MDPITNQAKPEREKSIPEQEKRLAALLQHVGDLTEKLESKLGRVLRNVPEEPVVGGGGPKSPNDCELADVLADAVDLIAVIIRRVDSIMARLEL